MNKIRLYLLLALPFVSCKSAEIKLGKELLPLEQTKTIAKRLGISDPTLPGFYTQKRY